jgi:hypothetical protein
MAIITNKYAPIPIRVCKLPAAIPHLLAVLKIPGPFQKPVGAGLRFDEKVPSNRHLMMKINNHTRGTRKKHHNRNTDEGMIPAIPKGRADLITDHTDFFFDNITGSMKPAFAFFQAKLGKTDRTG